MKKRFVLFAALAYALLFAAALSVMATTTSMWSDGVTTYLDGSGAPRPAWLVKAAGLVCWFGIVAAVGLAFLPFRRSQRGLPVFFRAHVFVPVLYALWNAAGTLFPFTPHQLTRTLPAFLLGADDWGVGNIYAYTKLADWVALLAGSVTCARVGDPATADGDAFAKRLRLCAPHLVAAAVLHFVPGPLFGNGSSGALTSDLLLLFVWLLAGFAAVALLQASAETSRRRRPLVFAVLVAFAWLFVPVACSRP